MIICQRSDYIEYDVLYMHVSFRQLQRKGYLLMNPN